MHTRIRAFSVSVCASVLCAAAPLSAATEAPDVTLGGFAVGEIKLMCRERRGWEVDFRRETDKNGVEYAVVEMKREEPGYPAPFNLSFNFPKRDTVGAWRPWSSRTGFGMYWNPAVLPNAGVSDFRKWMPLFACYGSGNRNRVTFAASESSEPLVVKAGIKEEDNRLYMAFHFYNEKIARRNHLVARLRIDSRDMFWSDAVKEAADWMSDVSGRKPAFVPDAAFAPLYSTWYNFHQNVFQDELERECAIASNMGMKTIIVDDGWQTDDTHRGYAFCGDWKESKRRFPDLKAHVARVHAMGMKYMMWYSVPFVGKNSSNWRRFKGKFLYEESRLGAGVLDPRFPEVREFLISTYEKAVREWDIDGLKLDFIDRFAGKSIPQGKSMGGRDFRSVTEATEKLIADTYKRLSAIKKDILIEFRQAYIGPSIRAGANMLRVSDCPGDMQVNRCGIANLRLTSGGAAVHADPLEWHPSDTPEAAAKNVLSAIFGTVQYSMKFAGLRGRARGGAPARTLPRLPSRAFLSASRRRKRGRAHFWRLRRGDLRIDRSPRQAGVHFERDGFGFARRRHPLPREGRFVRYVRREDGRARISCGMLPHGSPAVRIFEDVREVETQAARGGPAFRHPPTSRREAIARRSVSGSE